MKDQEKIEAQKKMLGALLKKKREANNVSTYKLEKAGITFSTRQAIENGTTSYTIDSLLHYCMESEIDLLSEFVTGKIEK